VIGITALVPLLTAGIALFWLEEPKASAARPVATAARGRAVVPANIRLARSGTAAENTRLRDDVDIGISGVGTPVSSTSGGRSWQGLVAIVALQLLFLWIGLRDLFSYPVWWKVLAAFVALHNSFLSPLPLSPSPAAR
jgi:hypothetical protein